MRRPARTTTRYVALLGGCFAVALAAAWTPLGTRIDNDAYDWMFHLHPPRPWETRSVVLAADEASLSALGGLRGLRRSLAETLERIASVRPAVVAIDISLADAGDPADDARLEAAFARTRNLVLPTDLLPNGDGWAEPLERFRRHAAAVGHVHADPDPVSRHLPLEKAAARARHWALSLEAFRLLQSAPSILESPTDLVVGSTTIPAARTTARAMRIRYLPPAADGAGIPRLSLKTLRDQPETVARLAGKVIFIGVTAPSAARDRLMTPYDVTLPGVEIHAQAFETLVQGRFLPSASNLAVVGVCLLAVVAAGLIFAFLPGWPAYICGALLLLAAHAVPHVAFLRGVVFAYFAPVSVTWLAVAGAASYQHFVVRRQLRGSESEKARYQQAIHFVTHEMRTPLTAIQGSSELIGRYNLSDEKRKQVAEMINSESKRLARMIQTFLDVERLSEGEMELKTEQVAAAEIVAVCLTRARVLADRKQIKVLADRPVDATLRGDRELLEYAFYNLLTNAIKYSPPDTTVTVRCDRAGAELRLSVADEGIGMDEKELKSIFQKFYRTRKAEASGEAGTGIGLSIVSQIVTYHRGRMEVSSTPGRGSCFSMILPASEPAAPSSAEIAGKVRT